MISPEFCRALRQATVLSLALFILAVSTLPVVACGPFFESVVFEYVDHPDPPFSKFASGELGIVRTTFARSYLIVAYRYLSGKPLESIEQKAALKLWQNRLLPSSEDDYRHSTARDNWLKMRSEFVSDKCEIDLFKKYSDFSEFLNYTAGSFDSACDTLKMLASKYGAKSKEALSWLEAQDQVFGKQGIPEKLAKTQPSELRAEREYQIASAQFYKGSYDEAATAFRLIATDSSSRWHLIAPYLAARALTRKGTVSSSTLDLAALREAYRQLENVLKNPDLSGVQNQTRDLLQFVGMKVDPPTQIREILNRLSVTGHEKTFGRDLNDATKLFDNMMDKLLDDGVGPKPLPLTSVAGTDLGTWLVLFQRRDADSIAPAIANWRKTKSLPWLICALSKSNVKGAKISSLDVQALLSASRRINESSPGYMSLIHYAGNLLISNGCQPEASRLIEKMLKKKDLPPSARNIFANQNLMAAGSLPSLASALSGKPAGIIDPVDFDEQEACFKEGTSYICTDKVLIEPVAASVVNTTLPLGFICRLSEESKLSPNVRKELIMCSWVRAAILNQSSTANGLSIRLEKEMPALKTELQQFRKTKSVDEKRFQAVFTCLKFSGLRPYISAGLPRSEDQDEPDEYSANWWGMKEPESGFLGQVDEHVVRTIASRLLTPDQLKIAVKEKSQLRLAAPAPNYLASEALNYARKYPRDRRVPEALHLAVVATRYGVKDDKTTRYSKSCFQLLHKKFPQSPWAKRTPYYY